MPLTLKLNGFDDSCRCLDGYGPFVRIICDDLSSDLAQGRLRDDPHISGEHLTAVEHSVDINAIALIDAQHRGFHPVAVDAGTLIDLINFTF